MIKFVDVIKILDEHNVFVPSSLDAVRWLDNAITDFWKQYGKQETYSKRDVYTFLGY